MWVALGVGVCEDLDWQMRLWEDIVKRRDNCNTDRHMRTIAGNWRLRRYSHSLTELLVLGRMVNWWPWFGLVGQRGCVLVGVRSMCSFWHFTGGAPRHWRGAAKEAAAVVSAAVVSAARAHMAVRRLVEAFTARRAAMEEIVLESQHTYLRNWYVKYLFECYSSIEYLFEA